MDLPGCRRRPGAVEEMETAEREIGSREGETRRGGRLGVVLAGYVEVGQRGASLESDRERERGRVHCSRMVGARVEWSRRF